MDTSNHQQVRPRCRDNTRESRFPHNGSSWASLAKRWNPNLCDTCYQLLSGNTDDRGHDEEATAWPHSGLKDTTDGSWLVGLSIKDNYQSRQVGCKFASLSSKLGSRLGSGSSDLGTRMPCRLWQAPNMASFLRWHMTNCLSNSYHVDCSNAVQHLLEDEASQNWPARILKIVNSATIMLVDFNVTVISNKYAALSYC